MISKRKLTGSLLLLLLLVSGALAWLFFSRPAFDPVAVGKAEAGMWQCYYAGHKAQLAARLVGLLRTQYALTPLEAKRVGEQLADAAMTFKAARGDYDRAVLPPLIRAYAAIKEATGDSFDPAEVARAELAWWMARRTPGGDAVENVGVKIGELYAALYGGDHPAFREAGLLRARAARLRDAGGRDADWERVTSLLVQAYTALAEAM